MPAFIQVSFQLSLSFQEVSEYPDEDSECMDSEPVIYFGMGWFLRLVGSTRGDQHHSTIYLNSIGGVRATFSMTLVNHRDNMKSIKQANVTEHFPTILPRGSPFIIETDHLLDPKHGFIVQDAITIEVQISIDGLQRVYDYRYSMAHEMKALLFDESTTNHHIIIGHTDNDQSMTSCLSRKRSIEMTMVDSPVDIASYSNHRIPVHKMILQSRSPVFKAMLSSAMKERTSNETIITDFDFDAVKEFIRFLYLDTCDIKVLDKHAKSLLAMAHKYDVKGLLHNSADYLIRTLSIDNAVEFLQLADLYEVKGLKKKALNFIQTNLKDLTKAGRLDPLSPELLHNLINHLADV